MEDFPYLEWLTRSYKEKAEKSGHWRDYLQAHGLANFCATRDPTNLRDSLVFDIEKNWYHGKHPLGPEQRQDRTKETTTRLESYREETRTTFKDLEAFANKVTSIEGFSEFNEELFRASKKSTDGLIAVANSIFESSVSDLQEHAQVQSPCKFAVIGLGSIAKGEATPYSDLEYAFIVEQQSDYFEKLAVESYFRIGNIRETPLKSFDIDEVKTCSGRSPFSCNEKTGFRIDGITKNSGNIPTGNGKVGCQSLILTVEELMKLYKEAANSPFDGFCGDKSDMFSSTVLIYTNENRSGSSWLYEQFLSQRRKFEQQQNCKICEKRLLSFKADMNKFKFLPEFVEFQPPNNYHVNAKTDIFRYPTILANNLKMCLKLTSCYPWDHYSQLKRKSLLSASCHQYFNIILAISIYIRTSAYLKEGTQTEVVIVSPHRFSSQQQVYQVPPHLFLALGCLLSPIKRTINISIQDLQGRSDIESLIKNLGVPTEEEHCVFQAEALYFIGRYKVAIRVLNKAIGKELECASPAEVLPVLQGLTHFGDDVKHCELCAYLLYGTSNYGKALEYFTNLITLSPRRSIWQLLSAHCHQERGDYISARECINSVKEGADGDDDEPYHWDYCIMYKNIGHVYYSLGEHKKALNYFIKSSKIAVALHNDISKNDMDRYFSEDGSRHLCDVDTCNNLEIAKGYSNIGIAYGSLGDNNLSLGYHMKSLAMIKAIHGEESIHPDIAISYLNIAVTYRNLGDNSLSLDYHMKSLAMKKALFGETDHPDIARTYNSIGSLYRSLGDHSLSLYYHMEALNMMKAINGEEPNRAIASIYCHIGIAYGSLGDHSLSLDYHMKSLAMRKAIYGEESNHPSIASSYNNIADAYRNLGDNSLALDFGRNH